MDTNFDLVLTLNATTEVYFLLSVYFEFVSKWNNH